MTVLQRIAHIVMSRQAASTSFEQYYNQLLRNNAGAIGIPTASEARRDLNEMRNLHIRYPYL